MATRILDFTAPVRWARVFEDNRDLHGFEGAFEEYGGAYTVEVGLTDSQLAELKAAGSMKKGREEEDGLTWVKFTRKHEDRFEWAGGAPKVVNATDDPWSFEVDGEITNDSEATTRVSVYDTKRPSIKGTRLEQVKVLRTMPKDPGLGKTAF